MTDAPLSLLLVGAGKMGGALLRAWLGDATRSAGLIDATSSAVIEPDPSDSLQELAQSAGLAVNPDTARFDPDVVVLAVKPQMLDGAIAALGDRMPTKALYVSIAAGKSLTALADMLPADAAIVRAMPNLPAWVGAGASVLFANSKADAAQKEQAERLMRAAGAALWVDEETQIDAATAISGSGPAYAFLLVECLAGAGQSLGLPEPVAAELARQTIIGAGAMLRASDEEPADLRRAVTSPAGTTEAALKVLMDEPGGLGGLVRDAVRAANARAKELAR